MEVKLALSPKQHASLRLGRKIRVHSGHLSGSGVSYHLDPEVLAKMKRAFAKYKGVDISLATGGKVGRPATQEEYEEYRTRTGQGVGWQEPHYTQQDEYMKSRGYGVGGSLANKLKRGSKILHFIGDEIIQPIAHFVAPATRPIFMAGSDAAVAQIDRAYNPGKAAGAAFEKVSTLFTPYMKQGGYEPVSAVPSEYVVRTNAIAAQANSFQPFKTKTALGTVGTPTSSLRGASAPTSGRSFHMAGGGNYLGKVGHLFHGRGLGSPALLLHPSHPALRSAWQNENFLAQIPQVFKDHKRMGAGWQLS